MRKLKVGDIVHHKLDRNVRGIIIPEDVAAYGPPQSVHVRRFLPDGSIQNRYFYEYELVKEKT